METLPAGREDLRAHLSGIEPERRITDWGRSEGAEALADRLLGGPAFRWWFRVEVLGIEHVPVAGGALLVANGAGGLHEAAMVAKAVRERHPRARPVHVLVASAVRGIPGLAPLAAKVGAVPAHPANVHRLLYDEGQLALAFPGGGPVAWRPRERYRLGAFDPAPAVEAAAAARVPVVPVAVVGGEEARPLPVAPGPLGRLGVLPAKMSVRFLPAIAPGGSIGAAASEVRTSLADALIAMLAARRSAWR